MAALCGAGRHSFAQPTGCRSEHVSRGSVAHQRHLSSACGRRLSRGACRHAVSAAAGGAKVPKVKICGVTSAEDARLAAEAGADFVGMILWPRTVRGVTVAEAKPIAEAALAGGAQPVAVFVDEDARSITASCGALGITLAQLHGDKARTWYPHLRAVETVYVLHSTPEGDVQTELPSQVTPLPAKQAAWVLLDGLKGGSGQALDWSRIQPPAGEASQGWMLAGGLTSGNVAEAVSQCQPDVVDVSSGVAAEDGIKKDAAKMRAFVTAATGLSPDDCRARRDRNRLEQLIGQA